MVLSKLLRWSLLVWTAAWVMSLAAQAQPASAPEPIPASAFYGHPQIVQTALSPSGRWLAVTTGIASKRIALSVFDLQEWKPVSMPANYVDGDIRDIHWVNDDRLLYSLTDRTRGSGDQRWSPGLFSVRRDGTQTRPLIKLSSLADRSIGPEALEPNHELLHIPAGSGDEVIVGERITTGAEDAPSIVAKRLNTVTGRTSSLSYGSPPHVQRWLFDPRGEPRVVLTRHLGRGAIHWRAAGTDTWRQLAEAAYFELPYFPAYIDNGGALFVTVNDGPAGTSVLKRFDFATGRPKAEALVSAPGFDFLGRIVSETVSGQALGVRVLTDAETTAWFDKRLAALQVEADQRLPGRVNRLVCRRCADPDMTVVVHSWSDRDPGQIWIYQARGGQWRKFGDRRPSIDPSRMATVEFERIRARDGQEIPVWLTLPPGKAERPRPAVVLVHAGPWERGGGWEWQADAQFLASRGYVVIEPEFRGSTGYGDRHFRAGWKQWGRAMQDDVADAVDWAVARQHVDARRVCIAGTEYGGYAALMGLVRHPEMYRCGIAWSAVSDPRLLATWRPDSILSSEYREFLFQQLVGDPVADAALLDSVSPVLLAARIKAPLLLAHGGLDWRVPPVHANRMRDALTAVGRSPRWLYYPDEGHGWYKVETSLDFARNVEDFLAEHLAPGLGASPGTAPAARAAVP